MFIVVLFIKSTGIAIVAKTNLHLGNFFCPKKLSSKYWQFSFLFGPDYQTFLEIFTKFKKVEAFLGLLMNCIFVNSTWTCSFFVFRFFSRNLFFFMSLSVMLFIS